MKYFLAIIATFSNLFPTYGQITDWSIMNLKSSPKQVIEQNLCDLGKLDSHMEFNFNSKGFLISEIKKPFVFGQNAIIKSVFTYNDNQTLQNVINYQQGKLKGKSVYTYPNKSTSCAKDISFVHVQCGLQPQNIKLYEKRSGIRRPRLIQVPSVVRQESLPTGAAYRLNSSVHFPLKRKKPHCLHNEV